jgi:hypothetical protein
VHGKKAIDNYNDCNKARLARTKYVHGTLSTGTHGGSGGGSEEWGRMRQ